ncbi:MAG: Sec-independent protein translocase protein TatB [Proteobacteria bacterium]|nr:Sec-independent protein translocase protein TatB [Pseudomonadota bacterium]MDA1022641.1 Sec-independent protein translocase protein TatB [Pseudomonadota bacterium]
MFDIGWQELFILAVLAIIVVGPKDLPRVISTITKWIRKARSMARDLQDGLDDVAREADIEDLKKELAITDGNDIVKRIGDSVDPTGELSKEIDLEKDVYDEMTEAADTLNTSTAPEKKAEDTDDTKKADG